MTNRYMPVGLLMGERTVLVVGGGTVAARKVETLLDYGARITVVAPEACDRVESFARAGRVTLEKREYRSPEASGYGFVVSAAGSREVNAAVSGDCRKAGVPVNVVDDPELCTVIFPAVVRRDNLTVSVSTDGLSPFLSGHLRAILEEVFPERWKRIAALAASFRARVGKRWPGDRRRRAECYARFVGADWSALLKEGDEAVEREVESLLEGGEAVESPPAI